MGTLSIYEMLQNEIRTLPEALAEEVFDFVLFAKARHAEENFLWKQIKESHDYPRRASGRGYDRYAR